MKRQEDKIDDSDEKTLEVEVKSTKFLIQTFLQTLKAYRLYEANHPILAKFLIRLERDFEHYFDEFDSFSLQVGEHRLFYRGQVVYENQDVKESLAFLFFKDGIREIRFIKGLESKEITDFLNVVRKGDLVNRLEDDLVTLLWERDFSHITFSSIDEIMEGSGNLIPATQEDLAKGLEYRGYEEEWLTERPTEGDPEAGPVVEGLRQAFNPAPGQSLVQACQLTPDEMKKINKEAEQEQKAEYLYVLINDLEEILLHLGEDADAYENMISYFDRTIKSFLEQGDIGRAVAILEDLNSTMESMVLKDKQIFAIRRILEASSDARSVDLLGKLMKNGEEGDSGLTLQYLRFLTKQAVDPLCLLLGELTSGKWRKVICDYLAELSREEIQPVTKLLSNPNPFTVCHGLYILGKVGHPSTVKYLGSLVNHSDLKVREETLKLTTRFEEKGRDLLERFLKDPVPEMRAKASLLYAKTAKGRAVKPLVEIILAEDFYKRDYEEKASFFRALGETGSEEAIPILKKIAKKRRWFNKAKWDEMRLCANNTLKMLGAEKG